MSKFFLRRCLKMSNNKIISVESLIQPSDDTREILHSSLLMETDSGKGVTPDAFIANYMTFVSMVIANGHPAKDTCDSYRKNIAHFLRWCLKDARTSPFLLREKHIELYRAMLYKAVTAQGTEYNQNTVYQRMVAVRAFYNAAKKQGLVSENPAEDVKAASIPINDVPFAYYKMEEIKKLVDYVKETGSGFECHRNLACIYLMGVAGLRCVEVHRANQEDINWNDLTMKVHGKGHDGIAYLDAATGRVLHEYLDCLAEQDFKIKKENGLSPLIVSNGNSSSGRRMARNSIRWNINKILEGADMKKRNYACHVLRHSCATALYKNTHDLRVVQDTLRHRNPSVTSRYTHVVEQLEKRPTASLSHMLK